MSTQKIFDNIISQFNNEEEEEEEEDEESYNNYKFNKISSILNNDNKPSLRISNKPEVNNIEHQENNDNNKFLMSFGQNNKLIKDEKDDIKDDNKIYEENNIENINNNFREKPSSINFSFKAGTQKLNHINNENENINENDIDIMNINEKKEMEELNKDINYSKRESERIKELMNNNNDELINNDFDVNNDMNNNIDNDNNNNNDNDNINNNLFTETLNTKIKDSNSNMILNIENNYNQNNFELFNNQINRQTFRNNNNNSNEINNENSNNIDNINNNNNIDVNNDYINDEEDNESDFLNKLEKEKKDKENENKEDINENKIEINNNIFLKKENENNNLLINNNNNNNNNILEKNIYENNEENNNYIFSELDEENDRIQREKDIEMNNSNNSNNSNNIEEQKEEEINKIKEGKEKKRLELQLELQKNQEKLRQLLMLKKQKDNQLKEVNDNDFLQKNNKISILDNDQNLEFIKFQDMIEINYNNKNIHKLINFQNEDYNTINNKLNSNSNNFNNSSDLNNMNKIHKSYSQDIITSNNINDLVIPAIFNKEKENNNELKNKKIHKTKKINKSPLRPVSTLPTFTLSKKAKTPIKTKNTFNKLKKKKKEENKSPYYKQFRMNKSSYKMLFDYNKKLINNIINKYSNNKKLTILGIAKCLSELKIFRELLYIKNNKNSKGYNNSDDYLKEIDIKKLIFIVKCIKKNEKRKNEEMNFLEQIWFILNPYSNEYINKEIFEGFIKLLFSYSDNINTKKEIALYIKDYLNIVYFMGNKDKNIPDEHNYSSPLRNKIFTKEQIWPIEKLVQNFIELKQNLIAYETKIFTQNNNLKKSNNNEENKEKNKKKKKKEKYDFNKLYESYMDKIQIKEQTLRKIRELQEKENIAKFSDKPKIIKKYNEKNLYIKDSLPVHEKLYRMRNDKNNKILKLKEKYKYNDEKDNSINNLSFTPTKYSKFTKDNIKDLFINNNEKPKGYQSFIKRNLSAIKKKKKDKKEEEDRYTGRNYEKTMKMKFQPPKIKDMEDNYKKGGLCEKNHFTFPDFINDDNENSDTEDSTIEIKIPNGKIVKFKFDINEDINKIVENFCKIYSLRDNVKQKLIKKIEEIKNYFNQNEY